MSLPVTSPLSFFSKKNVLGMLASLSFFLFVLAGFFAYDSFNWYVRAKGWPLAQAGLDSSGYCGRRSTECSFIVEYNYQKQMYHQKVSLPKGEYTSRLDALNPGEDSKSILVDIKINPEHPEEIIADPKIQLGLIGGLCIVGLALVGIFLGGARLFNHV